MHGQLSARPIDQAARRSAWLTPLKVSGNPKVLAVRKSPVITGSILTAKIHRSLNWC
jgi:hypothetical protein